MMTTHPRTLLSIVALSFAVAGCERSLAAPNPASATATAAQAATAQPKATKIVFVGKQNACQCTRKSIDAGWAALQKALGTPAKLPVQELAIDTESEKVEPFRKQKPMMALPAIYFVDGKDAVLALLQGEVTEAQIAEVLKR
jgi:hypothetical protein